MKPLGIIATLLTLATAPAWAQQSCLARDALLHRDAQWEQALLESNVDVLTTIMAKDFIWVHDHASMVDTKASLLERASDPSVGASGFPRSRVSSDVEVRVLGSTGVVTGFTVVDRGPTPTRYNFMRTYVEVGGRCVLLANHTMAIPDGEG